MTARLDSALKRELDIEGELYTLTLTPQGFKLTPKGKRLGYELQWADLVSGDAALATELRASLAHVPPPTPEPPPTPPRAARAARAKPRTRR
jgi:hypothetical protein